MKFKTCFRFFSVAIWALFLFSSCARDYALSEHEVAELLVTAGFKSHEVGPMLCIARYESAMRPEAINVNVSQKTKKSSYDIGLFQINTHWWARPVVDGGCGLQEHELFNSYLNTHCARRVFNRHGYDGWNAYKSHKVECNSYQFASR